MLVGDNLQKVLDDNQIPVLRFKRTSRKKPDVVFSSLLEN
jgi:hypothetical protein